MDYNVSFKDGQIGDDLRIRQTLPTIEYLLGQGCRLVLMSHLGRPEGKVVPELSLRPVAEYLQALMKQEVSFGEVKGKLTLLENVRFDPGDETNDERFSKKLAGYGEIFVNDAFGVSHRAHASTVGVTRFLPAVAGLLLEKEVDVITGCMEKPQRPLVVIIGGAKLETKVGAVEKLLAVADKMLVGGAVANEIKIKDEKMLLPLDGPKEAGVMRDIGARTIKEFGRIISRAKTIIWNGPMGMFEKEKFRQGTDRIYEAIRSNKRAVSVVGGGDTLTALRDKDLSGFTHVSTGGGALLEFIEKGSLPGIDALLDK